MTVLVSDTSVLIDIERSGLETLVFSLGHTLAVPDLLYERELKGNGGELWLTRGLKIEPLNDVELSQTQALYQSEKAVSLIDCSALVLAQQRAWTLMSGDRALRTLAGTRGVACHGILWIADELEKTAIERALLADALERLINHPRCRLPAAECQLRIERLRTVAQET